MAILKITKRIERCGEPDACITLSFDQRQRSRLRAKLDSGEEVGLMLPRGTVLRGGDLLCAENNLVIAVKAAKESVTTASSTNPQVLSRAAYHLGNRHVPVEIGPTWVRYLQDHVLDHMVESLGLEIRHETQAFEPEAGAYHSGGHHHHAHDE